jgi:hypothetical protein
MRRFVFITSVVFSLGLAGAVFAQSGQDSLPLG